MLDSYSKTAKSGDKEKWIKRRRETANTRGASRDVSRGGGDYRTQQRLRKTTAEDCTATTLPLPKRVEGFARVRDETIVTRQTTKHRDISLCFSRAIQSTSTAIMQRIDKAQRRRRHGALKKRKSYPNERQYQRAIRCYCTGSGIRIFDGIRE